MNRFKSVMVPALDNLDPKSTKQLLGSVLLSIVILGGSAGWTYSVGLQANRVAHELDHVQESVENMEKALAQSQGLRNP